MNYLIINSHPYEGSFNRNISNSIQEILEGKGSVEEINLVEDHFDPVMRGEDLRLWGKGQSADPMVEVYQKKIEWANRIIFLFPVWWGYIPAVLKGFCEKVLLSGWAYEEGGFAGLLKGKLKPRRAIVISTMRTPGWAFGLYFHNPVKHAFIRDVLASCGIKVMKYMQIGGISSQNRARAEAKMAAILRYFHKL